MHGPGICQNPHCSNPVPVGRRKYCSDACRHPAYRARVRKCHVTLVTFVEHAYWELQENRSQLLALRAEIDRLLTQRPRQLSFFEIEESEIPKLDFPDLESKPVIRSESIMANFDETLSAFSPVSGPSSEGGLPEPNFEDLEVAI